MHRAELVAVDVQKRETLKQLKASTRPKENREQGSVKYSVYKEYIKANGYLGVRLSRKKIRGMQEQGVAEPLDSLNRSRFTCSPSPLSKLSRLGPMSGSRTGLNTTRRRATMAISLSWPHSLVASRRLQN